jgi:hypothetical protein
MVFRIGHLPHTWLTAVNPIHVAQWGTFVTTPRVLQG